MNLEFVNREAELKDLDAVAAKGGVLALYGRRRVGKTRLLVEWLKRRDGWYSQAMPCRPQHKWSRCQLAAKHPPPRFEVMDAGVLDE
ncbi:MAG: hypothetical protein AAB676_21115 [Verrucomicrobiota bacterium]